jgi:transposase
MPKKELQRNLVEELRAWCGDPVENRGRRAEVARAIGVSRGLIRDWLARPHKAFPGWENGLRLQAFLRRQRRKKSEPPRPDPMAQALQRQRQGNPGADS